MDANAQFQIEWRCYNPDVQHREMKTTTLRALRPVAMVLLATILTIDPNGIVHAAGCAFALQGEDRVSDIVDGRTFRLQDGREVRLAGVELATDPNASIAALSALIAGRDVVLRGETDMPDRYGRQPAFVFLAGDNASVQSRLLTAGAGLLSPGVTDRDCVAELIAAESSARKARKGIWASADVIKNTESPGDILARVGQFTVIEGRVFSVRQAGATTYINFGPRWTQDFAVTISRRMVVSFEGAGLSLKSLENRRLRVRGWIERRGGPRIDAVRVGQIEVISD